MRQVIVGVSGSPASITALRCAAHLAHGEDVLLVAVHAWTPPGGEFSERRLPSGYLHQLWQEEAAERLKAAVDLAFGGAKQAPRLKGLVVCGRPGPALAEIASCADDLLVLGAGHKGALSWLRRAPVSRYCQAHAQCPLLILPQPMLSAGPGRHIGGWAFRHRELTAEQVMRELQQLDQGIG
jgi:nucleotide-binding universal stress UspA family protein